MGTLSSKNSSHVVHGEGDCLTPGNYTRHRHQNGTYYKTYRCEDHHHLHIIENMYQPPLNQQERDTIVSINKMQDILKEGN